ncbi:MAG: hypothetical protein ACI4KI_00280 [Candidatus Fimenecus sp.]
MFQKLGLKDIFTEIWYRKFIIAGIAVLAVLCAIVNVFVFNREEKKTIEADGANTVYTKTILVNIEAKKVSPYYDMLGQSQKLRNLYLTTCKTEYFAQYLQDNFSDEDNLGDYLIAQKNKSNVDVPDSNIKTIADSMIFEGAADSSSIKLSFQCTDSDIGDEIIGLFIPYMEEMEEKLGESEFVEIARSSYVKEVSSLIQPISSTSIAKNLIKNLILFVVGFEFLYLLVVLLIVMLVPKVHTVNDLKNYFDAPVWEHK